MRSSDLHRLSRVLREVALAASGDPGERPTYGETVVVEDLARHGPSPIGVVAERTGVAQSLVSKVVAALAAEGVAVVEPDPADSRRRLASLAPGIRERLLQPRGERPVGPAIAAALPHLDARGAARAESLLTELSELLRPA